MAAGKTWIVLGGLLGATGVMAGAYHAHGLRAVIEAQVRATDAAARTDEIDRRMHDFEVGSRYQLLHALALLAVGSLAAVRAGRLLTASGACFLGGVALFSGLLYAIALGGPKLLGAVVPVGGLSFVAGWLLLVVYGAKLPARQSG